MVLQYVAVAFALAALALFIRWLQQRGVREHAPFPAISMSSCVVLAVLATFPVVDRVTLESRLSHTSSTLLGLRVEVDCQTLTGSALDMGNELGYVKWGPDGVPERQTLIKHQQCNDLHSYLNSSKQHPSAAQILAVHVLTHESMHMSGIKIEYVAECAAMQHDTAMAEDMGATPAAAHALAVTYWLTVYPNMPDGYRSSDCRPGGSLDLHLPDAPWAA
ncbi:MAG TPA: hypothetical protein VFG00_00085 [Acidothermaceae bacterium]|nr:hypothetical protein [Acidothermaceae bacterium]